MILLLANYRSGAGALTGLGKSNLDAAAMCTRSRGMTNRASLERLNILCRTEYAAGCGSKFYWCQISGAQGYPTHQKRQVGRSR